LHLPFSETGKILKNYLKNFLPWTYFMEILSILFGFFEEKDGEKILKIIGILFQYFFNISVPSIILCIQCE